MGIRKRGLSPVVASVLMILLVLALASLVFAWARGFVDEHSADEVFSASQLCEALDFSVVFVDKTGDDYDFEAVNYGNVNISSLKFRVYPGGDSNIFESHVLMLAGGSVADNITLTGAIDRVEALGVLDGEAIGSSYDIVCSKNPVPMNEIS